MEDEEEDNYMQDAMEKEMIQNAIDEACACAWKAIIKVGFDSWFNQFVYQTKYDSLVKSKVDVVKNLITYYENQELYERCGFLKSNLDRCVIASQEQGEIPAGDDEFFQWMSERPDKI